MIAIMPLNSQKRDSCEGSTKARGRMMAVSHIGEWPTSVSSMTDSTAIAVPITTSTMRAKVMRKFGSMITRTMAEIHTARTLPDCTPSHSPALAAIA